MKSFFEGTILGPHLLGAAIVDEAHSSQSGDAALQLRSVLSAATLEEALRKDGAQRPDYEDEILRAMLARGRQPNLSFFAFTTTPKHKTLEVFGSPSPDGKPVPFHLYTMRQAIEEGFILDVLRNFTTYRTYFRLVRTIDDDPDVEKRKAARALARFTTLHPHNLHEKTEVMVEHFRRFTRRQIGGKAKAMLVTPSRLHAVLYKLALDDYIRTHNYPGIKALVAFSGTVKHEGLEYTEVDMNGGIRERELPERFASDEFNILIVAEKFQTGFDQPLLHTMHVDKRLSGVQAVQTLSRLNRTHPGKTDTFVLDFVNEPDEIHRSFQPYYEQTSIAELADPAQLYALDARLAGFQIFFKSEVETFARAYSDPARQKKPTPCSTSTSSPPSIASTGATRASKKNSRNCWSPIATSTHSSPRSCPSRTPTSRSSMPW